MREVAWDSGRSVQARGERGQTCEIIGAGRWHVDRYKRMAMSMTSDNSNPSPSVPSTPPLPDVPLVPVAVAVCVAAAARRVSIADRVSRAFPPLACVRGFRYFARQRVTLTQTSDKAIDADVKGTRIQQVQLRVEDGRIAAACTCSAKVLGPATCRHVWATLLEIDRQAALPGLRSTQRPLAIEMPDALKARPSKAKPAKALGAKEPEEKAAKDPEAKQPRTPKPSATRRAARARKGA